MQLDSQVKAHSLILRLLSPSLGALLPPAPLKPPVTIPLPDLEGAAVKAYLVHLYSGDPDDLVEGIGAGTGWKPAIDRLKAVLTLSGVSNEGQGALLSELELRLKETLDSTLGPADDGLPSIPETEEDDNDDDVSEIDVKPSPAKPPSEFSKALTALRSLDPPQGLLASPLLVSALSQRPPLTPAQLGRLTAGLDFDVARQGTSLEWPGGEIQKFHWIRGWIDSNGIARKSPEAKELAGSIRLDRISLDDLETIVEVRFEPPGIPIPVLIIFHRLPLAFARAGRLHVQPSGIIPLRLIVRQYTVMARRLRATSNIPLSRSAQIAAAQQQQALQQAQSPIAMAPVMQPPGVVQGMAGVLGNGVGEARIKQEAEMRARQEEQRRFEEQRRAQEERARQEAAKAQAEANARAQEAEQRRQEELRRQQDETRARMEAEGKAKAQAEAAARAQAEAQAKAQAEAQARAQAEAAQRAQAEATARAQAEAAARAQADAASAAALLKRQQEEQARAQAQLAELEAQRQALLRQEQELAARATPTVSQLATPAASRDVLPMRAESPLVKPVFGQQSPTPNSSNPSSPPKPQPQQAASMPQPSMTSPAAVASSSAVPPSPAHALSPLAAAGVPPGSPQQPAGFDSWVAIPDDISVQQDVILFRNPEVASTCRMKNPLTSGKWRWVLLVEKTA